MAICARTYHQWKLTVQHSFQKIISESTNQAKKIEGKRAFQKSLSKIQFPFGGTLGRARLAFSQLLGCTRGCGKSTTKQQHSRYWVIPERKWRLAWTSSSSIGGRGNGLPAATRRRREGDPFASLFQFLWPTFEPAFYARDPVQSVMLAWRGQHWASTMAVISPAKPGWRTCRNSHLDETVLTGKRRGVCWNIAWMFLLHLEKWF